MCLSVKNVIFNKLACVRGAHASYAERASYILYPRVRVCGCKLCIPGDGGCNLTGGLTLVNPLLGVLRMMM